jgi:tripartite-type tricarboxylate transporter receptor subunit TctC
MTRSVATLLFACGLWAGACGGAAAQSDWPNKTIRAILPVAPGTGADVVFRLVFHELGNRLGQQIVIENRGGAGGTIGSAAAAKADPDGYTILAHSTGHAIAPALYPNISYDVTRDFIAVVPLGKMPTALIISPSKGINSVRELVEKAKANPGTLTFASAGVGSTTHLTAERFLLSAGITAIHVPFRGGGFRPEVSSGRVDFAFSPIAVAIPDVRDGRLLALAVSAQERASGLPEVPTLTEASVPNADYALWLGVFLPAKTPRAIVDRLHDESAKALATPALRERLAGLDVEPMPMSTTQFDAFIRDEVVAQAALAKAAGLKPN